MVPGINTTAQPTMPNNIYFLGSPCKINAVHENAVHVIASIVVFLIMMPCVNTTAQPTMLKLFFFNLAVHVRVMQFKKRCNLHILFAHDYQPIVDITKLGGFNVSCFSYRGAVHASNSAIHVIR